MGISAVVSRMETRMSSPLEQLFAEIDDIGHHGDQGYYRLAWTSEDAQLRDWFERQARACGFVFTVDSAGNQWAWWGGLPTDGRSAVTTGSHLDSVPGGGRFDGPLGVLSAFAAVDLLRSRGFVPSHPIEFSTPLMKRAHASALPASGHECSQASSRRVRRWLIQTATASHCETLCAAKASTSIDMVPIPPLYRR